MGNPSVRQSRKRKRLLCEPRIQLRLMGRTLVYWFSCIATLYLIRLFLEGPIQMAFSYSADGHRESLWVAYSPPIIATFLFLPLVLYDVLKLSNRFVGPMHRLRGGLVGLANGEPVSPINFRQGDLWHEFAEEFNRLRQRVESMERAKAGGVEDAIESRAEGVPV